LTTTATLLKNAQDGFEPINVSAELKSKAVANLERWLTGEAFADARPQIERLIENENYGALFDAFFQQIPFGTGGRRGPVGFGTNRINPFTISTSIQGHCDFLRRRLGATTELSVVVAYDVRVFRDLRRNYDASRPNPLLGITSKDFARIAAQVYAANGIRVWFPSPERKTYPSTPELSFTIRHLAAHGGLNISASHNHPDDSGAKIYNAWGAQEIPPLDEEMAIIVESISAAKTLPWDDAVRRGLIRWTPADAYDAYIRTNAAVSRRPGERSARVVFTPLHGTGWTSVGSSLERAGFDVECFPDQAEPDGSFPNVLFRSPNPEVRETLGPATEYAKKKGATIVLAADPDADRIGMAVPLGVGPLGVGPNGGKPDRAGEWTCLNGNQIGTVLAAYLFETRAEDGLRGGLAVTTVVTTSLFRRIAEAHGVHVISDLGIGFKYIADVLNQIEEKGEYRGFHAKLSDFVLGIEESHGYLVTAQMRDKDAAGAGVLLAELTSLLERRGKSVPEYLDDIYLQHGYVSNHLVSTVMLGARGFINIRQIQASLREKPPERIGSLRVLRFSDRMNVAEFGPFLSDTDRASRDLLTFELEGGGRIVLRPSGTESKNKIYVEVVGQPLGEHASREDLIREKREIDARARTIAQDFCLESLRRIGVEIPRWALDVSDLVALEWKQDFAASLVPELIRRLRGGETGKTLESWVDGRLAPYGADGRLLVRGAIVSFLESETQPREIRDELRRMFRIQG
jgi:phosphoglucomutase